MNSGQGVLSDHPEDFTLFEIGTFDIQTGTIELFDSKVSVANGLDVKDSGDNFPKDPRENITAVN